MQMGVHMSKEGGRRYQTSVFRMYFNHAARLRKLAGALYGKVYAAGETCRDCDTCGDVLPQLKIQVLSASGCIYAKRVILVP